MRATGLRREAPAARFSPAHSPFSLAPRVPGGYLFSVRLAAPLPPPQSAGRGVGGEGASGDPPFVGMGHPPKTLRCPNCKKLLPLREQYAGQLMKCPLCTGTSPAPPLPVPPPAPPPPPPPTPA